jgi:hypothetical protein
MKPVTRSARYRELVWEAAMVDGDRKVFCVHCHCRVMPADAWDICHTGAPAALGGTDVGVGHRTCNIRDNIQFVTSFVAATKRKRRRHLGIIGPGLGDNPLPAGKRSGVSKTLRGEVVPRLTQAQKHRRAMAERYGASK